MGLRIAPLCPLEMTPPEQSMDPPLCLGTCALGTVTHPPQGKAQDICKNTQSREINQKTRHSVNLTRAQARPFQDERLLFHWFLKERFTRGLHFPGLPLKAKLPGRQGLFLPAGDSAACSK